MSGASSNVFSIPPGAPFLPTLVGALLDGQLLDGFRPSDDPLTLASTTIWVPTRRAARVLVRAFSDSLSPQGILLPAIRTFGDADDASARLELDPDPQPTMEPLERQILLSRMIDAWSGTMNATAKTLYEGRDVLVPSSQSDALWFAADLARLMDTVATEEVDWSTLLDLSPPDHGAWWELTTEFLKIATQTWPAVLAERGASDPAHLRVNQLRAQAALYRTDGAQGPVIAAGSTGSIPATADLLRAIRSLPNGAVILPGLDRDLDEETWAKIDLPDAGGDDSSAAQGHPQFGLKRLLSALDVAHGEVVHLGSINDRNVGFKRIREAFISEAMRPAHASHRWLDRVSAFDEEQRRRAFDKASLIVAANEREEAAAIAVALRDALETDNATAALITPDRTLARRVAVELARFGVPADDSAGLPLANQSQTHLFRLVAQIAFEPPHAVTLASLLQSPHVRFGLSADQAKRAGQILELAVLRGALTPPRPADLPIALAEARGNMLEERDKQTRQRTTGSMAPRRLPAVITTYSNDDWRAAAHVAQTLADAFAGAFRDLANTPSADFATLTLALRAVFEQMCSDDAGLRAVTSEEPAGQHLETTLAALVSGGHHLTIPPQDYHACFDALIASETVRVPSRGTPRISILGPIEARLQTFDRVVLGGLTDGVWPAGAAGDPFLSRPMKSQIGLPAPERRIGLAAHDFQMLAGVEDVVFSRSERRGDAPVLPSRWLQRLEMLAGDSAVDDMTARGQRFISYAKALDAPSQPPKAIERPRPTPPVAVRPARLSVTEIETWIKDPYAIYAKHVLGLQSLDTLSRSPGPRERGTLYHDVMEDFVTNGLDPTAQTATADHLTIARYRFDAEELDDDILALWWARFEDILERYLAWNAERYPHLNASFVELYGSTGEGLSGFTLSGRLDRLDQEMDGGLSLWDYKTSSGPALSKVESLDAPQLPLILAMLNRGGFETRLDGAVDEMGYLRLRVDNKAFADRLLGASKAEQKKTVDLNALCENGWRRLQGLIAAYGEPDKGYISKARPMTDREYQMDFDHLARVREWMTADDEHSDDEGER